MKRTLTILYLMLYMAALSNNIIKFDPNTDSLWDIGLECAFHISAVILILFYVFNSRPESLRLVFKIFPLTLIIFDISSLYPLFRALVSLEKPISDFILAALIFIPFSVPSWYLTFRFGYLKSISPFRSMTLSSVTEDDLIKKYKIRSYGYAVSLSLLSGVLLAFTINTKFGKHSNIHNLTICIAVTYLIAFYYFSKAKKFAFIPRVNQKSTSQLIMIGQFFVLFTFGCLV